MNAYRKPVVVAVAVLLLCSALFVKGYKSAVKKVDPQSSAITAVDEEKIEDEQVKALTTQQQEQLEALRKADNYTGIAAFYDSLNMEHLAGSYYFRAAKAEPDAGTWKKAGDSYLNSARQSTDSLFVVFAVDKAKQAYNSSLELDKGNNEVKNALALCMAQGGSEVMQAVKLLKEVLDADSNNIQAIYTLGMLSIQSGQYDKAAERFEKLRQLEPTNAEYYYYLADIYSQMGQKDKAVKALEVCKALTDDKKTQASIDELIKEILNH
jgi:tetratricopeptide (TPR) repeat protein